MVDKTGIIFEVDPTSAEKGEKRISAALKKLRENALRTADSSSSSLGKIAAHLTSLERLSGPSASLIQRVSELKTAMTGLKAPSSKSVENIVNLLKKTENIKGPDPRAALTIGNLSRSLSSLKAPSTANLKNIEVLFKSLSSTPTNFSGLTTFTSEISKSTTVIARFNRELGIMMSRLKTNIPSVSNMSRSLTILHKNISQTSGRTIQLGNDFRILSSRSLSLSSVLFRTSAAVQGLVAVLGAKQLYDVNVSFQTMEASITSVTNSSQELSHSMKFITDTADYLGIAVTAVGEGFAKFLGSLQGTSMSALDAEKVFYNMSKAGRVLHLSTADLDGIFRALSQIMSKGSLQAEELRGQLGDRLVGAFSMMAKAAGLTTAELGKLMKQGKISGQTLTEDIKKFSDEYGKLADKGLEKAIRGIQAEFSRLSNAFSYAGKALGEAGLLDAFSILSRDVSNFLNALREQGVLQDFGNMMKSLAQTLHELPIGWGLLATLGVVSVGKMLAAIMALNVGMISSTLNVKKLVTSLSLVNVVSVLNLGSAAGILSTALEAVKKSAISTTIAIQLFASGTVMSFARAGVAATTLSGLVSFLTGTVTLLVTGIRAVATALVAWSPLVAVVTALGYAIYKAYSWLMSYIDGQRELDKQMNSSVTLNKELNDLLNDREHLSENLNVAKLDEVSRERELLTLSLQRNIALDQTIEKSKALLEQKAREAAFGGSTTDLLSAQNALKSPMFSAEASAERQKNIEQDKALLKTMETIIGTGSELMRINDLLNWQNEHVKTLTNEQLALHGAIRLTVQSGGTLNEEQNNYLKGIEQARTKTNELLTTTTENTNKTVDAWKSLNSEIDKIISGDSFGNIDRLTELNDKVKEYTGNLESNSISQEKLAKIEQARTKILDDLKLSLSQYVEDKTYANQRTELEIQQMRAQASGLKISKRAENELEAAIEKTNLAREQSITLRQMEMSYQIALNQGHAKEADEIKKTIESVKQLYEQQIGLVDKTKDAKNELDKVEQELSGPIGEGFKSVAEAMQDGMQTAVEAVVTGTKGAFGDLWDSIKSSFAKALGSMIMTAAVNPILINVLQTAGSSIGLENGTINSVLNGTFGQNSSTLGTGSSNSGLGNISGIGSALVNGLGLTSSGGIAGGMFSQTLAGVGNSIGTGLGLSAGGTATLTGAFGAMPYGALGGMGASLLGLGGGVGGMVGNIAGSLAGGAIGTSMGTILGLAGGPLGAIIGGFLGTAIGGLFGNKKPTNAAAFGNLNLDTGVANYSHMNKGNSEENMGILKNAFDQVMTFSKAFNTLGVGKISGSITGIDAGVRDNQTAYVNGTKVTAAAGEFGKLAIASLKELLNQTNITDSNVKTALTKVDFTDLEKALTDISFAANFTDMLKAFRSEVTTETDMRKAAVESAKEMTAQLQEFKDTTARLGLSTSEASSATKTYIDNLVLAKEASQDYTDVELAVKNLKITWEEMTPVLEEVGYTAAEAATKIQEGFTNNLKKMTDSFNKSITDQIQQIVDPTGYAISQLDEEFAILRRNAVAVGGNLADVERLYGLKRQQILEQALQNQTSTLRDWLDKEIVGSTSTLSPAQKLQEAQSQFGSALSLARLGDATSLANITGLADNVLNMGQNYYASSPEYEALRTFVRASIESLGTQLGMSGFNGSEETVSQLIALRQENGENNSETVAQLQAILSSIDELNRRLLTYSVVSGGRA